MLVRSMFHHHPENNNKAIMLSGYDKKMEATSLHVESVTDI